MQVYYDRDADLAVLKGKKVAVLGYGSQGHAHANNLRDSGVDVIVGLRRSSNSWQKAEAAGLEVADTADAAAAADIVMVLLPDELQGEAYEQEIKPGLKTATIWRLVTASTFISSVCATRWGQCVYGCAEGSWTSGAQRIPKRPRCSVFPGRASGSVREHPKNRPSVCERNRRRQSGRDRNDL